MDSGNYDRRGTPISSQIVWLEGRVKELEEKLEQARDSKFCIHREKAEHLVQEVSRITFNYDQQGAYVDELRRKNGELAIQNAKLLTDVAILQQDVDNLKMQLACADEGLRKSPTMKFWERAERVEKENARLKSLYESACEIGELRRLDLERVLMAIKVLTDDIAKKDKTNLELAARLQQLEQAEWNHYHAASKTEMKEAK